MLARYFDIRATGVASIFGAAGPTLDEIGLSAWIAQAEPGETLVYHRGFLAVDTFGSVSHLRANAAQHCAAPLMPPCALPNSPSLFGVPWSSAFEQSFAAGRQVFHGPSLLFGISTLALPSWDQKNEAAQSDSRPGSYELLPELDPLRTRLTHRSAQDAFPPAVA